jgi:hypothetical protein
MEVGLVCGFGKLAGNNSRQQAISARPQPALFREMTPK